MTKIFCNNKDCKLRHAEGKCLKNQITISESNVCLSMLKIDWSEEDELLKIDGLYEGFV